MASPTTTTTTTAAPVTTPTPERVAASRLVIERSEAGPLSAAVDAKKARLLPAGPWTQAGAAEGLSAQEAQTLRAKIETIDPSIRLWAKTLPPEGVDIDGFRTAWGELRNAPDAEVRTVMRVVAEYAGVEFVPGEAV